MDISASTPRRLGASVFAVRGFGRFAVVGAFNTAVGFALFPVLYTLYGDRLGYGPTLAICYVGAPLCSFLSHKFVTFRSTASVWGEIGKYGLFYGIAFPGNLALLHLIAGWDKLSMILAQTAIGMVLMLLNYLVLNRYVFAHGRPAGPSAARKD